VSAATAIGAGGNRAEIATSEYSRHRFRPDSPDWSLARRPLSGLEWPRPRRLQANRKCLEGAQHPDRNAQFEHLNETLRRQLEAHEPAISVDTKKKELVGAYANGGRELRAQGDPEDVHVHDFVSADGKVAPYGLYDLHQNEAWVSVG
jgi:hypothetical protein